jgi:hypothetical protein
MTTDTGMPDSLLRVWPNVPADAWERLSEHRYRAPHEVGGFVICVVVAFGETIGQGARTGSEGEVYASLFGSAGRLAAHRASCENGTPIVRPDDEANRGVVGRCWWCGKWPSKHELYGEPHRPAAPHYADDPDAPYFEHLYAAAQAVTPGITRDEVLATVRAADPDDTLRIRQPHAQHPEHDWSGDVCWCGDRHADPHE